jgi:hypothetical protein
MDQKKQPEQPKPENRSNRSETKQRQSKNFIDEAIDRTMQRVKPGTKREEIEEMVKNLV